MFTKLNHGTDISSFATYKQAGTTTQFVYAQHQVLKLYCSYITFQSIVVDSCAQTSTINVCEYIQDLMISWQHVTVYNYSFSTVAFTPPICLVRYCVEHIPSYYSVQYQFFLYHVACLFSLLIVCSTSVLFSGCIYCIYVGCGEICNVCLFLLCIKNVYSGRIITAVLHMPGGL